MPIVFSSRGIVTAADSSLSSYTTLFPTTESPLSEGGRWIGGAQSGMPFGNMNVTSGFAYADRLITTGFDDSLESIDPAFLNCGDDHYVETVMYRDVAYTPPDSHECEHLIRCAPNPAGPTFFYPCVEINLGFNDTHAIPIAQSGAQPGYAFYSTFTDTPMSRPFETNDTLRTRVVGSVISVEFIPWNTGISQKIMVLDMSVSDGGSLNHTTGQPGFGAFVRTGSGADPSRCCFKSVKVGRSADLPALP